MPFLPAASATFEQFMVDQNALFLASFASCMILQRTVSIKTMTGVELSSLNCRKPKVEC